MFSAYYKSLSPCDKHNVKDPKQGWRISVGGAYLTAENNGFQVAVYGAK